MQETVFLHFFSIVNVWDALKITSNDIESVKVFKKVFKNIFRK